MRTRKNRTSQYRRRRAGVILLAGGIAWALLYMTGYAGTWQTVGLGILVGLVLVAALFSRAPSPSRDREPAPHPVGEAPSEEPAAPPRSARRPNAIADEYNNLARWPSARQVKAEAPHPTPDLRKAREKRPTRMPLLEVEAEQVSKMPPPVPPPLYGRPGSRPIVAGMEGTVGQHRTQADDEVAATVAVEPAPAITEQVNPTHPVHTTPIQIAAPATPIPGLPRPGTWPPLPEVEAVAPAEGLTHGVVADMPQAEEPEAELPKVKTPQVEAPQAEAPTAETPLADPRPTPVASPTPHAQASPVLDLYPERPVPNRGNSLPEAEPTPPPAPVTPAPPREYHLPSLELLPMPASERGLSDDEILERASLLERTLASFGVEAKVVDFAFGPAVTRYELQPGPGVRVNKFTALADDLALAMAAVDVRVEAPIPGKSAVGIEVPNRERLAVPLREVLQSQKFKQNSSKLAVAFGKDNSGHPVVGDLARMPHLLIAGSTGSGKSVCMNSIICSLLYKAQPDEVKMLMIDPKMVELSIYNGIPHLTAPVITDVKKAAGFLKGAVTEMEGRYELFAAAGVRNIEHYNQMVKENPGPDPEHPRQPLPYIVIFIDELADLMMVAPADVEDSICRLAQMARACGMHLVIATQSPRVDVITGLIKANVPSRIAFAVSSQVDSRVILDSAGAERLLGRGDMLYHPSGLSKPLRAQGAFIDESSVEELVRFVKAQGEPEFTAQEVAIENGSRRGTKGGPDESHPTSAVDEALPEAARIIIEHGQASVSILQRRLRCNYTKASRLIDMLEDLGLIGPHQGSRPREVLASMARWQELFGPGESQSADGDLADE